MATRKKAAPKTLATALDALDDDFHLFTGEGAAKREIVALEKKLGIPLRADHQALIAEKSCLAVLASEEVWPRPVEFEVRPSWQFCFGIEIFGVAPKTAPALDVVLQTSERKPAGKKKLVAAMRRIGERSCIGYDRRGALFEWEPGGDPRSANGESLEAIALEWIGVLATDKDLIKATPPKSAVKAKRNEDRTKAGQGKANGRTVEAWSAELLDDDGDAEETGKALMKEDAKVRGKVIDALASQVREDETDALWALGHLEGDARAIDALLAFATKGNTDVRTTAIGILGVLDSRPEGAVAVLVRALGDKEEEIVQEAAEALAAYPDESAIEPLGKALGKAQKKESWVYGVLAGNIMTALAAAGPGRDDVIDVLTRNLAPAGSHYAALPAFEALIAMGRKAKRAVPALTKLVAGKNPYLATLARHALGAITGSYAPHLAALKVAAKSKDSAVKAVAEAALRAAS